MEAWADLATALDESSVFLGRNRSASGSNSKNLTSTSKQPKNKGFSRRRTKSTGNIIGLCFMLLFCYMVFLLKFEVCYCYLTDKVGNSSSSEGEMEDFHEQAQSSVQQVC